MRKSYVQIAVCCLLMLIPAVVFADKTADDLWEDYQDASINAGTASTNYNTKVDAAKEISGKINENDKTLSETTQATLRNLFVAGGLYAISAPTVFIPALGQVKPTIDMINAWLNSKDLEALKVVAEQAASDAHRKSVQRDQEKAQAYTAYITQYRRENPTGTPKPPLDDVDHKVYNFACHGGCGVSWDNVESARLSHRKQCPDAFATVAGCGKSYYSCTDTSHTVKTCTNLIGYQCGVKFRECSNNQCSPSGSLWQIPFNHSGSGSPDVPLRTGRNICEKCGLPHGN